MINQKQEWNIRSRSEQCVACQKPFEDQDEFYALLIDGEEGLERRDYCAACWAKAAREDALSVWQSVFRVPPPPPPEALKKETAESLFRKLIEQDDPTATNTLYILAVMLERRRLLIERDVKVREDGSKLRVYEYRKTNEVFLISDPGLKLAELEHVQEEVVARLGGGDPAAATEAAPDGADAAENADGIAELDALPPTPTESEPVTPST